MEWISDTRLAISHPHMGAPIYTLKSPYNNFAKLNFRNVRFYRCLYSFATKSKYFVRIKNRNLELILLHIKKKITFFN